MLFCHEPRPSTAFIRMNVADVKVNCEQMLNQLYGNHSKMRREYINRTLLNKVWWWERVWKWFFLKRPTRRDAIDDYLHGGTFPAKTTILFTYGQQIYDLKDLLRATKASAGKYLWVSPKAVRAMGF